MITAEAVIIVVDGAYRELLGIEEGTNEMMVASEDKDKKDYVACQQARSLRCHEPSRDRYSVGSSSNLCRPPSSLHLIFLVD